MTTYGRPPRVGYHRRREIERVLRIVKNLQLEAMLNQRACEKEGLGPDAAGWWIVSSADNEQFKALQTMKGGPAHGAPRMHNPPPRALPF